MTFSYLGEKILTVTILSVAVLGMYVGVSDLIA